jgi:hypothetical protein
MPTSARAYSDASFSLNSPVEQRLDLAVHDHRVQTLFATEVFVDQGFRNPGSLSNLFDRSRLETLPREDVASDLNELLTTFMARHASATVLLAHAPTRARLRLLVLELLERNHLDIPCQP